MKVVCCGLALALGLSAGVAQAKDWLLTTDLWGNPAYQTLHLDEQGASLSGDLGGDRLTGSRTGRRLTFAVTDSSGAVYRYDGQGGDDSFEGVADYPDTNDKTRRAQHRFSARRLPDRPAGPPRTYDYSPDSYSNTFDPHRKPVMVVWPGDTVRTSTIDSGGVDKAGVTRALFGNPQVGPFFVAGAEPGDTLVVRLRKLSLNRDWADSLDAIVGRAQSPRLAAKAGVLGKPIRWRLDRSRGLASPEGAVGALAGFSVPVRPMLGGLAVAPGFGSAPISTGDTGAFGGNMDFNEVVEGAAVLLPVQQPGALLYLGDAHALQGDGESSQYALETSMDVAFTVEVVKGRSIPMPRVESASQIMVLGQGGSLDDALRSATWGMTQWLEQDYGLDLSQSAQVLGSAAHYTVVNLAGRSVGVAAKLDKSLLRTLSKPTR